MRPGHVCLIFCLLPLGPPLNRLLSPRAPTWSPGQAQTAILLERGIEMHKSHISQKMLENNTRRASLGGNCVSRVVQTLAIGLHHGPGCSKMAAPGRIFLNFMVPFARLCSQIHQGSFRCPILAPLAPPDRQKLKRNQSFPSLPNPTDLTYAVRFGSRANPDPLCDMIRTDGATSQVLIK